MDDFSEIYLRLLKFNNYKYWILYFTIIIFFEIRICKTWVTFICNLVNMFTKKLCDEIWLLHHKEHLFYHNEQFCKNDQEISNEYNSSVTYFNSTKIYNRER